MYANYFVRYYKECKVTLDSCLSKVCYSPGKIKYYHKVNYEVVDCVILDDLEQGERRGAFAMGSEGQGCFRKM